MNMQSALPTLDFHYARFLDRMTILLGASGSGKSTVMVDALHSLKDHVGQIVVVSPTDRQNHTYDRGLVPLPCIHYVLTEKLLNDIWERQNALVNVYTRATDPSVLRALFDKIPNNGAARQTISEINRKLRERAKEVERSVEDLETARVMLKDMEAEGGKLIIIIFKQCIAKNREVLRGMNLSPELRFAEKYFELNPRLVLIFDDCTDLLKKFKSHPVIQKLFFQGRWAYITCLIACHTDKVLDPELKKNAFVTIFTEETSAHAYFERGSNDLTKAGKKRANDACNIAFSELSKYQKLAFVREENKFYQFVAEIHPNFQFGSEYVWQYCNSIKASAGNATMNNRFISDFSG